MAAPISGLLVVFVLAIAMLAQMVMLQRREVMYIDRLEAYVRSIGNHSPCRSASRIYDSAVKED